MARGRVIDQPYRACQGTGLRIEGKGLPRYPGHGRGRLDVAVLVDIPRQLCPRQRQLYERLRAEDGQEQDDSVIRRWPHRQRAATSALVTSPEIPAKASAILA
jgi:DnaJ-class molecular chaperone